MFHLVLGVCLAMAADQCGQVLLPQGDSESVQGCQAQAAQVAEAWLAARPDLTGAAPELIRAGRGPLTPFGLD